MKTRITLYHDCILSARYTEVFRNQTLLDAYLNGLTKPYTGDIDIPKVYTTLTGTVSIDTSEFNNAYNTFNYIKFEEIEDNNVVKQKVYAFVDTIRIINDLYVITYSVDVWHTYFKDCTLRESLITNSRFTKDNEPYFLPLEPVNNANVTLRSLIGKRNNVSESVNDLHKFAIICKMQFYQLSSGGDKKNIESEGYYIYHFLVDAVDSEYTHFNPITGLSSLSTRLDNILQWQQNRQWIVGRSTPYVPYYCNIVETYVVPANWLYDLNLFNNGINNTILYINTEQEVIDYFNPFSVNAQMVRTGLLEYSITGDNESTTINKKYIKSLGLFTSQIPYKFNGLNKYLGVDLSVTKDTINFYLSYETTLIDITEMFAMYQDYEVVSPDVLAQREIARKQATIQGITGTIRDIAQIGVGVVQTATGMATSTAGNISFERAMWGREYPSKKDGNLSQQTSGVSNIVGGVTGLVDDVSKIAFANKEKYMSFIPTNNYTSAIINAYFGICIFAGLTIINENEVTKAINETGYSVDYFVNSIDVSNSISTYNVVKFGFVRLVGLSTEICEKIASILTGGVKIWYVSNV